MTGLWAVAGALLVLAAVLASPDDVARPVRAALLLSGLALVAGSLLVSIVAATLEGP